MKNIQNNIAVENNNLKNYIQNLQKQINDLDATKNAYIEENNKLQATSAENAKQLDTLKDQVEKLKQLYDHTKELLATLASTGDAFDNFNKTIGVNVTELKTTADHLDATHVGYDHTLEEMKNLLDKLRSAKFADFDKNHDGMITAEEFAEGISEMK